MSFNILCDNIANHSCDLMKKFGGKFVYVFEKFYICSFCRIRLSFVSKKIFNVNPYLVDHISLIGKHRYPSRTITFPPQNSQVSEIRLPIEESGH